MPFVITEPCIGIKDSTCVEVCPVDCIETSEVAPMYYIDAKRCIDCAYCESVCPVHAIFDEFSVPGKWREYIKKNRQYFNGTK